MGARDGCDVAFEAINEAIAKQPQSVFTYEYLLAACDGCDPRVLNYVYFQAMRNVTDNALLLTQYGEFLEEMNEYEAAREVFRKAYAITPTDDLARSVVRVGLALWRDVDERGVRRPRRGVRRSRRADRWVAACECDVDEYQSEVVTRNGQLVFADESEQLRRMEQEEDDDPHAMDPHETATHMMPRLLADKAV